MIMPQRIATLAGTVGLVLGSTILLLSTSGPKLEPAEQPEAQPAQAVQDVTVMAPTVPPAVSVNALMVSSIDHAAHVIWDAPVEPPMSDEDWLELEYHAIQLAAMGTLISLGGSGPLDAGWARQPDWERYSQEMTDVSAAAREAARNRNVGAVTTAGDTLLAICESCHDEFKPESPTEGLLHTPHYPR